MWEAEKLTHVRHCVAPKVNAKENRDGSWSVARSEVLRAQFKLESHISLL